MQLKDLLKTTGLAALAATMVITALPSAAFAQEEDRRGNRGQRHGDGGVGAGGGGGFQGQRESRGPARMEADDPQPERQAPVMRQEPSPMREARQEARQIDRRSEQQASRVEARGDQAARRMENNGNFGAARQVDRATENRAERIEQRGDNRAAEVVRDARREQWNGGQNWNRNENRDRADNRDIDRNRTYADRDRNQTYRDNGRNNDRDRGDWNNRNDRNDRGDWNRRDNRGNDWRNNGNNWNRDRNQQYRSNQRRWDRDNWRRDNRYDWNRYRYTNRNVFTLGRYYSPYRDYSYRRLSIGFTINSLFFGSRYWINDPWQYRLPAVYGDYRWVRYYDDVLLVDTYTGEVVDVIHDFFW